jgi:carotenoid 1,2-hydratase
MPATPDPDRFLNFGTPGSQEWWYFDALGRDGRDALVLVWYAGLPFDPSYGVAALRHRKDPRRRPAPHPLDHAAVGLSWYRDGRTLAYALNAFPRSAFSCRDEPFRLDIAGNALERDGRGYRLRVETPAVDGRSTIEADLTFAPTPGTEPLERDLGQGGSPHLWILAAADCRVAGTVAIRGRKAVHSLDFEGRGYHDHNAGSEEISLAMRRWAWGRVHLGPLTHVYYRAEPHAGHASGVWITLRDGRPERTRDDAGFQGDDPGTSLSQTGNVFGVRHGVTLTVSHSDGALADQRRGCVDDGPFYRRWVGDFLALGGAAPDGTSALAPGVSELLDTRNLNRPLFNWMIPYRLKRPRFPGRPAPG